jgi:hypothetical protein
MAAHARRPPRRPGLPLYAWAGDPEILYSRAKQLGEAAADAPNGLDDATIGEMIGALIEGAKLRGFTGNADSLRIRLWWAVRDARAGRERAKRDVERHLQRTAIAAIARGLSYEAILEAAEWANAGAELPMSEADFEILVQVECAIESRRRECPCSRRRECPCCRRADTVSSGAQQTREARHGQ